MTWLEEMGNRIREELEKCDYTQTELAEWMDVNPHTVSRWCCGNRMISTPNLIDMCQILNCSADYILFGKE